MKTSLSQSGMTLIEIMIALLLGAFLMGGVIQIFTGSKQTNKMQDNLSRIQENGRFAMDFIARDLRQSGFRDCLTFAVPTPITGINGAGNAPDSISINQSTGACGASITQTISYTIQPGATGQPAIFRAISPAAATELIEGVDNMQIVYGEDLDLNPTTGQSTDYVPNRYVAAGTAGLNMARVVSIRIRLLLSSMDNNLTQATAASNSYSLNGSTIIPGDRRLRRVITSTIAVRNRLR